MFGGRIRDGPEERVIGNVGNEDRPVSLDHHLHRLPGEPRQEERARPQITSAPRLRDEALDRSEREMEKPIRHAGAPLGRTLNACVSPFSLML
jgi:hypothetical protein